MSKGSPDTAQHRSKRRRFIPLVWLSGVAAAGLLALGVSGTLSSWTSAQVTNQANQAGTGQALILQETGPDSTGTAATCTSSTNATNVYTCTKINKYGDAGKSNLAMVPGDSKSTAVTLTNTGGADAATFTLAAGTCVSAYQSPLTGTPAQGLCDALQVAVSCKNSLNTSTLNYGPVALSAFSTAQTITGGLTHGSADTCTVTVSLPASTGPVYGGQTATQDLVWTLTV